MFKLNPSGKTVAALAVLVFTLNAWSQKPDTPPAPATVPASQGGVAPFDMTGFIQFASVDSVCARNAAPTATNPPTPAGCKTSGGWIQINGHVIRVPQNTILQMPANTLTWEETFEYNSVGTSNETGLALSDSARLPGTFEVHVQGNVVNGTYIAGLIFISQQSLNSSQGFIESLDYQNGVMVVNGTKVQINDPLGRFSVGKSPDLRFSIDEDNPTVRAETAFPMCIPRQDPSMGDDPLCPQKNRPRGSSGFLTAFTMDPRGAFPSPASPTPTDSTAFAPFEVGDYVTYAGTLMDGPNGKFISAHTIIANVGIYTTSGDSPAYIAIDVVLQGAPGIPNPGFPQEATAKVRVEGFSTDPSRPIDIFAIDQDCNGTVAERAPWAFEFPVEQGPPTTGLKGRFRFLPNGGAFLPPSRNIGVKIDFPAPAVYNSALGIMAGRYQAPNFTFIFPENLSVGAPPVPLNFSDLPFLVNGSGPWGGFSNQPVGQLNPWPSATAPSLTCNSSPTGPPPPPGSSATATYSAAATPIVAGTLVTLNAAGSTPSNGPFVWTQVVAPGDPAITLGTPTSMTSSFTAPAVSANTNLTFQVSVGGGNSTTPAVATVTVPIAPPAASAPPSVNASSAPVNPVVSGAKVTLTATGIDPAGGTLTYTWTAPQGVTLTPSGLNGAKQTFTAPTVPAGSTPNVLSFAVIARSSVSGLTSTTNVAVTVNPILDVVTITSAVYRTLKGSLTVNVTDITPGIKLTCTLNINNPATGKPWTGVMGPAVPAAAGNYTIVFTGLNQPTKVTVSSTGGGTASSGVTRVRQ